MANTYASNLHTSKQEEPFIRGCMARGNYICIWLIHFYLLHMSVCHLCVSSSYLLKNWTFLCYIFVLYCVGASVPGILHGGGRTGDALSPWS
jgi:4-hydroxybenzoate polyprenyltransferase